MLSQTESADNPQALLDYSEAPTPSADDLDFNRRLAEAADIIGMHLQDHLILGHGGR